MKTAFLEEKAPYLLLLANIIIVFSLIPLSYEVSIMKMTSNIPYITLISLATAFIIFIFGTAIKKYWFHVFIYFIGLIAVMWMLVNKKEYDANYTKKRIIEVKEVS